MSLFESGLSRRETTNFNLRHNPRPRKLPVKCRMPNVEPLEDRRMLSVSASTLDGAAHMIGASASTELMSSGTVIETNTATVVKRTTFNGQSALETDAMGSESGGAVTTMSTNYGDLTSAGEVGYEDISTVNNGGSISTVTRTYSPPEVLLPPTMVAGTPYTEMTTATSITTGAGSGMMVTQQTTVLTLEAAQKPVTVPAGPYMCYVIDETITTTSTNTVAGGSPITTGPITNMGQEFFAQNVGFVELAIGSGITELTSFTPGSGGGGGGGTGLTPAITAFTVPPAVVGGAKLHGAVKVALTNSESTTEKGFTVNVYASTDQTLDTTADTLVTTAAKPTSVKPGKKVSLNIPITKLPSTLPDGTYYLIIQTVDSAGNINTAVTATTVTVAAPFVSLTATLGPVTKVQSGDTLTVTDAGNIDDKSGASAVLGFSTDSAGLDAVGATDTVTAPLHVKAGKSVKIHLKGWKSILTGLTSGVPYYLTATITDASGNRASAVSSTSFMI